MRVLIRDVVVTDDHGKCITQHRLFDLTTHSASATAADNRKLITFTPQRKQRFTDSVNQRRRLFTVMLEPQSISDIPKVLWHPEGFVSAIPVWRIRRFINIMHKWNAEFAERLFKGRQPKMS